MGYREKNAPMLARLLEEAAAREYCGAWDVTERADRRVILVDFETGDYYEVKVQLEKLGRVGK